MAGSAESRTVQIHSWCVYALGESPAEVMAQIRSVLAAEGGDNAAKTLNELNARRADTASQQVVPLLARGDRGHEARAAVTLRRRFPSGG